MLWVPDLTARGASELAHDEVEVDPIWLSEHVVEDRSEVEPPVTEKVTVPVGWDFVPEAVSDRTGARVAVAMAAIEAGAHVTTVEVERWGTVPAKLSAWGLAAWSAEPP